MSRIKITVKSLDQANELIEYWKDRNVELLVDVKPKKNTTTRNSDVVLKIDGTKLATL